MATKNKIGRPTKFTEDRRQKIYKLLAEPISITAVCRGVHISWNSLNDWRKRGEDIETQLSNGEITEAEIDEVDLEFLDFFRKCDEIEMELEKQLVKDVLKEKNGKKFILGKRFGAYRDKREVEHSGNVDVSVSWKDLVVGDVEG